jgi:2-phospho-L-lactate guanylyltransferase
MNEERNVRAILPVKRFANAKSRLAPVLDGAQRRELARRMFEDVLETLLRCRDVLAGTIVVTADAEAATIARRFGASIVFEADERGINAAVRRALALLDSDAGALIVPSDIPHLSVAAIAAAATAIAQPMTLAIAAAAKDGGTNLLACRAGSAVPLHYGRNSYVRHTRAAEQAGFAIRALHVPELLLDIDRPDDLHAFQSLDTRTRTHAFLSEALLQPGPNESFAPARIAMPISPQSPGHDL